MIDIIKLTAWAMLCLAVANTAWAGARLTGADDCRQIRINKRFVGIPDSCAVDACETWRSGGALGRGTWRLESTFTNFRFATLPPFGEPVVFGTVTDTFTARNGDVMYAMNAVSGNLDSPLGAGIMYVNGGTGRFQYASGRLFIRVDNDAGKAKVNGELCGVGGFSPLD